jgi:hypothetical protein
VSCGTGVVPAPDDERPDRLGGARHGPAGPARVPAAARATGRRVTTASVISRPGRAEVRAVTVLPCWGRGAARPGRRAACGGSSHRGARGHPGDRAGARGPSRTFDCVTLPRCQRGGVTRSCPGRSGALWPAAGRHRRQHWPHRSQINAGFDGQAAGRAGMAPSTGACVPQPPNVRAATWGMWTPGPSRSGTAPRRPAHPARPASAGQRGWISPIGPKPSCGVSM